MSLTNSSTISCFVYDIKKNEAAEHHKSEYEEWKRSK